MTWNNTLAKTKAPSLRIWKDNTEIVTEWTQALAHKGAAETVLDHYPVVGCGRDPKPQEGPKTRAGILPG